MKRVLVASFAGTMLLGCAKPAPAPQAESAPASSVRSTPAPEIRAFTWGDATISVGMTKAQVIEQIAKSGIAKWKGQYGIRPPSKDMQALDEWSLSYGNASGAAPGGGGIFFFFGDGKLTRIKMGAYYR
jgi:hypothetical protein